MTSSDGRQIPALPTDPRKEWSVSALLVAGYTPRPATGRLNEGLLLQVQGNKILAARLPGNATVGTERWNQNGIQLA